MKNRTQKRLIILSVILILFIVAYLIKDNLNLLFPEKSQKVFAGISSKNIDSLKIVGSAGQTSVYKKNDHWYTKKDDTEFKADSSRIESLIEQLADLEKTDVISKNKTKHSTFGIGKQKIIFNAGSSEEHTIYIGTPSGSNNYVAVDTNPDVFVAAGLGQALDPLDYRDLTVRLIGDENDVATITLSYDSQHIQLDKKSSDWQVNNQKAKKDRVDFFINDLKTMKADDLVKHDVIDGMQSSMQITVSEKAVKKTAEFYEKDAENYFVSVAGSSHIYQLKTAYVQSLKKEPKDFTE